MTAVTRSDHVHVGNGISNGRRIPFSCADKRYFNSGLKLTWNCGDTAERAFTGTGTVFSTFFYYTES
jgi:hypothetical protein